MKLRLKPSYCIPVFSTVNPKIVKMSMEAYVSRAPKRPKSTRMDLNKALNIMGYNGWSELVPGNYFII